MGPKADVVKTRPLAGREEVCDPSEGPPVGPPRIDDVFTTLHPQEERQAAYLLGSGGVLSHGPGLPAAAGGLCGRIEKDRAERLGPVGPAAGGPGASATGRCSIRRTHEDPRTTESVEVKLKGVRFERLRDFGDVWLAWGLWRLLGLDTLLAEKMPDGREEIPWATVAAILTLARFCAPCSELHIEDHWYARTALEDLLGVPAEKVHTDRLYAGLDRLLRTQRERREAPQGAFGGPVRSEVRAAVVRRDQHVLRGRCAKPTRWPSGATRATVGPIACRSVSAWW